MKKYILKILCICMGFLFLSGCGDGILGGKRVDGRREEESGIRAEGEGSQGRTHGAGNIGTADLGNKDDTQSRDKDAMQGDTSAEISFIAAGAYREIGLKNPPDVEKRGETYSGTFLNAEGKIELVTFSPWVDIGGEMLFRYILKEDGASWDRQPILWTEGLKGKMQQNRITVLLGEDQNYYAYYCDERQLYHMVRKEGESFVEIVIKDWDKSEVREYPAIPGEVAVLQCGNIVMVDTVGNCFIYSPDGSKTLASFRCGWCETICVAGNNIFVLDYENTSILRYDGKNMKMLPSFAGDFTSIVRLSVFEDTLFVCSPEGIFSAELKEENLSSEKVRLTKWLDAGKFHFSKENGYPLNLFSLGDTFYIVYAEQWGRVKKYVPRKDKEEFLGTLTVYSLENSELVIDMIAEFTTLYPEIDVRYETGEGAQGSTLISDHIRALNTQILAGDGPDILILDGLPAQSYVKKGILADLSTVLFGVLGELQENIVSNYRQGNRIYMLPMRYMIPMIATSGQNVQIFGSLSDLVAYCEEGEGNKIILPGVPYSYVIELLYYNFPPKIVSEDGSVNKDNLLTFIHLAKRFCEAEGAVASEEVAGSVFKFQAGVRRRGYFDGNTLSSYGFGEQKISFVNMTGIYGLSTYPELVESCGGALLGNKGMFFPNGIIGVNAYAKEKDLAYQFIEAVFSYEMQWIHSSNAGFSIYGKVLSEDATVDRSHILSSSRTGTLQYFNKKDARQMIQIAKVVQVPVERNEPVFWIINDAVCACLRGEKNEEETVQEIIERIQLYYFE